MDIIIQARMGSNRLPGKVLKKINKTALIKILYDRLKISKKIDRIIIATSTLKKDDPIINFCKKNKILFFRGKEKDVLDRYYRCALKYECKNIVRITADCPLIDPLIINKVIKKFINEKLEYCSNRTPLKYSNYPDGTDVEIFSFLALKKAHKNETKAKFREHVTLQFYEKNKYKHNTLLGKKNYGHYRYTLDYEEDLILIKEVIMKLNKLKKFGYVDQVVKIINDYSLYEINAKHNKIKKN